MKNRIRFIRGFGMIIAVAGAVASAGSVVHGDITVWVSATSPNNNTTFDVEAAGNTPSTASAMMIGATRTAWDPQSWWWSPTNLADGFHNAGHMFLNTDSSGYAHTSNYSPVVLCNQVIAIYACDIYKCPNQSCLTWAGQNWSCISPLPMITYVRHDPASFNTCVTYGGPYAFDTDNARGYTGDGDWAYDEFKGECAANEWAVGVSSNPYTNRAHSLLCAASTPENAYFTHYQHTIDISNGNDGYGNNGVGYDWDYGYYKGECGNTEIVTGLSEQSYDTFVQRHGALRHVRCSSRETNNVNCRPKIFSTGNAIESPGDQTDWASGYYKGECNGVVAGVSRSLGGSV